MFLKPLRRSIVRRRARAHRREVITAARLACARRDHACRVCRGAFGGGEQTAEMHELESRAALRGQPPEVIFRSGNVVLLHRRCHREITEHRLDLVPMDPDLGADGVLEVQRRLV